MNERAQTQADTRAAAQPVVAAAEVAARGPKEL